MFITPTPHGRRGPLRHPPAVRNLGLVSLVLALVWPTTADALALPLSPDARDTMHGFLFGLAFGLLLLWLFMKRLSPE